MESINSIIHSQIFWLIKLSRIILTTSWWVHSIHTSIWWDPFSGYTFGLGLRGLPTLWLNAIGKVRMILTIHGITILCTQISFTMLKIWDTSTSDTLIIKWHQNQWLVTILMIIWDMEISWTKKKIINLLTELLLPNKSSKRNEIKISIFIQIILIQNYLKFQ